MAFTIIYFIFTAFKKNEKGHEEVEKFFTNRDVIIALHVTENIKLRHMKYCLILLTILTTSVFGQNEKQLEIKSAIEENGRDYLQEKIYTQFDKPLYAPGETIWFKVYIMAGIEPTDISKNVYIDFSDAHGKLLQHGVAPVIGSTASGQFTIPEKLEDPLIQVHIYTKWMLNFDSAFLFKKTIPILQTKPSISKNITSEKIDVQVFPESGNFIDGIATKVAFKAISSKGKPVAIQGIVQDNAGKKITTITTLHDEMGFFEIVPKANEKYSVNWKDAAGQTGRTNLPDVQENGLALKVLISPGKRSFVISRNENPPPNFLKGHLVATMAQQLVYMASVDLSKEGNVSGFINTASLPSGILQLTLFDSNWLAVAERITFINNNNYSETPEVGFSVLGNLNKRGKNTLVINLPDSLEANYSVSVTDAGIGADSSDNIITHFLLTGELRGRINNPSYYFTNDADSLQQQLDLVMLTNGWRKIKWEDLVKGKMPDIKFPRDTAYLTLRGRIFGINPQTYRNGMALFAILAKKDSTRQLIQMPLKRDGSFEDPGTILVDTIKMYYQVAGSPDLSNTTAIAAGIDMLPAPQKKWGISDSAILKNRDTAMENRSRYFALEQERINKLLEGNVLEGVTVATRIKTPEEKLDEAYTSGLFSGGEAATFDVLDDKSAAITANLLSYLTGRVPGMSIINRNELNGGSSVTYRGLTPVFFLNENKIDITQVNTINMSDVAYIKVFRPPFIGSFAGGGEGGAVAIYTKKGVDATSGQDEKKGMPYKIITGYTAEKEFYSPNYGSLDLYDQKEDMRSTLYWNPVIEITPDSHTKKFTFYNNDVTNSYRIILEGFTKDGKLSHVEKVIE